MTPGDYPTPAHAAYLWFAGNAFVLGLPPLPVDGHTRGHTVRIPANTKGLKILIEIMRARSQGIKSIGTKSQPTQYNIEDIMKRLNEEKAAKIAAAEELLEGLNL